MRGRLLTLASGRVPASARLAAAAGLLALFLAWFVFEPGHQAQPRILPAPPHTLALPSNSPWVDRAQLADPASLYLQGPPGSAPMPILAQPEATPFLAYGPDLRSQPGQPLSLTSKSAPSPNPDPLSVLLESDSQPLLTLGQKSPGPLPSPRDPLCEVVSDQGEILRAIPIKDMPLREKIHKMLSNNILSVKSPVELRLGIDTYGLQSPPFLTLSSGHDPLDQAFILWASNQPWAQGLPPGSYRLRLGP